MKLATDKQIKYIKTMADDLGIKYDLDHLSIQQASQIIEELIPEHEDYRMIGDEMEAESLGVDKWGN